MDPVTGVFKRIAVEQLSNVLSDYIVDLVRAKHCHLPVHCAAGLADKALTPTHAVHFQPPTQLTATMGPMQLSAASLPHTSWWLSVCLSTVVG